MGDYSNRKTAFVNLFEVRYRGVGFNKYVGSNLCKPWGNTWWLEIDIECCPIVTTSSIKIDSNARSTHHAMCRRRRVPNVNVASNLCMLHWQISLLTTHRVRDFLSNLNRAILNTRWTNYICCSLFSQKSRSRVLAITRPSSYYYSEQTSLGLNQDSSLLFSCFLSLMLGGENIFNSWYKV